MSGAWIVALATIGVAVGVAKAVMGVMIREEMQTRLGRLPFVLIRLASARVPRADLRDDLAAEWNAELEFVLTGTDGLPLTRLMRGVRYSTGLLLSAREITDGLGFGDNSRVRRLTAAALAMTLLLSGSAVWMLGRLLPKSRRQQMIGFADRLLHVSLALLPPDRRDLPRGSTSAETGKTDLGA
jgi:hypothetical protein